MSHHIRDGGVGTLWRVSYPLILTFLSQLAMISIDRMFLAQYSPVALSAAVSAGMAAWAFTFGGSTLTHSAGVFVAQYNGAAKHKRIGEPVWQMFWLGCGFSLPFAAAALWLGPWLFQGSVIETEQVLYYRWMLAIAPLFAIGGALNGFFIGRGQTSVLTWTSLLGNGINLVLDPILIFGWGPIPSYGMPGACIATGIGMLASVGVSLWLFLRPKYRQAYNTGDCSLRPKMLWRCVKVGGPEALAITLELGAWSTFYCLLSELSPLHIMVASVGQSLLMLFFWFAIGVEHGASTVAGNLMGQGRQLEVWRVLRSSLSIIGAFALALGAMLWLAGDLITTAFLNDPSSMEGAEHLAAISPEDLDLARGLVSQSLFVIWLYIVLEDLRSVLYGLLRAAGDTAFLLWISVLCTWSLLLLPTYLIMSVWKAPPSASFGIWLSYAALTTLFSFVRFWRGRWVQRSLLETPAMA